MPAQEELGLTKEDFDRVSLASAYRANLITLKEGMGNRLPDNAQDVTAAIDLIDEAVLNLTVYINRLFGSLHDE